MASEEQDSGAGAGLFDSLKTLVGTMLGMVSTRLDLLSTELEEERVWLSSMLVWMLAAMFFAGLGIVMSTLFFVFALWDEHRLLALGIPALIFLLVAACSCWMVFAKTRSKPRLFSASLAELDKDRERLSDRP